MQITGWRRLIFGLYSVTGVCFIEYGEKASWSQYGAMALVGVVAFFYGERMVDSLKGLVTAIKGKFSNEK